ncbi:hypothetical protein F9231_10760 [Bacillus safensis]|nr:hypothetical protein F9229_10705 [Bacillus safensis]KAB3545173.1 hypothetical protein F9231_10760 [Bacillus safensis]NOL36089.1 hypothetical protein [Bacillus safensis]
MKMRREDKPSHSLSVLCASAHECIIRSAPVLVLPSLQKFSITLKCKQKAALKAAFFDRKKK